ncbi:MAG TPA: hypothetical protein VKM55_19755, partial [Candidatus Lokiarchaeia archaeon]|nr:hypothetical protein [Candidatus Lokiarchaeia archaeon]
ITQFVIQAEFRLMTMKKITQPAILLMIPSVANLYDSSITHPTIPTTMPNINKMIKGPITKIKQS